MFEETVNGTRLVRCGVNPSNPGTIERTPAIPIRVLLAVEAASFLLAAMVHAGVFVRGYGHDEAMLAEAVIGTVLFLGLVTIWIRPQATFTVALGVQAFALLGTFVGVWTIVVGIGPRTLPDVAYHAIIVVTLVVGIGLVWRRRATGSGGTES